MLRISNELLNIFEKLQNEKLYNLLYLEQEFETNYLDLDQSGLISFTPKSKLEKLTNNDSPYEKFRSNIKFGRLLVSLFDTAKIEYKQSEIEELVNKYKSIIDEYNKFDLFDIVSGEDIIKWYHYKSNLNHGKRPLEGKGSLGHSCSGHAINLDLYKDNPEKIKLVILYSDNTKTKIIGRCILWVIDENISITDRIYVENDSDYFLFKNFSIKNNFWRRSHNTKYEANFVTPNNETINKEIIIPINNKEYFGYPYLDTFKFYNKKDNYLSNKEPQENKEGWFLLATYGGKGGWIELETGKQHNPLIDPYEVLSFDNEIEDEFNEIEDEI